MKNSVSVLEWRGNANKHNVIKWSGIWLASLQIMPALKMLEYLFFLIMLNENICQAYYTLEMFLVEHQAFTIVL